ncbi:hypothetical protein [Roseomonas sp. FDAARGOS_362]|uniref:hypothetical protein n=1 Tax=Roseomonas sp. FDAARGOS_362 TaxID=2018065 RepID=UPI000F8108FB|nr:hypothetical protein [Roseomonas sp. FDAARGOS_362]
MGDIWRQELVPVKFRFAGVSGCLDDETIRLVESGRRRQPVSVSRLRHVGVVSEADLQDQLIQQIHNGDHADIFGKVLQINVNPIWLRPSNGSLIRDGRDIPDLVIGTETHAFIMELRRQISIQMAYSNFAVIYATRTCFVSLETGPSSATRRPTY